LSLPPRDHYWDHAMCWLDADRIALGGLGDDEDAMVDGARIFAVAESGAAELGAFAGPAGEFFTDGERLFSADEDGLSVWDVETGARTGHIDGFRPTRQHVAGRELVEPKGATLRRFRY
jgi:hypothetical protein